MKITIIFKKDLTKHVVFQGPVSVFTKNEIYTVITPQITFEYPLHTIRKIKEDVTVLQGGAAVTCKVYNFK